MGGGGQAEKMKHGLCGRLHSPLLAALLSGWCITNWAALVSKVCEGVTRLGSPAGGRGEYYNRDVSLVSSMGRALQMGRILFHKLSGYGPYIH